MYFKGIFKNLFEDLWRLNHKSYGFALIDFFAQNALRNLRKIVKIFYLHFENFPHVKILDFETS